MKYLLDTCVLSELVTKQPDPKVVEFVDSLDPDDVYLSVLTIGEIVKGIEKLPNSRRKQELHTWLKEDLLSRFQGKIIPIDEDVIVEWGILTARIEAAGKPMPAIDSLIAATAQTNRLALVTRNVDDFSASGVKLVNPWVG
ncbi:type II toxin-antitoxin system VapC family toxin [bacterium]|nr:type II toxin-antitoxin system VapC family toxin [bacterium]PIW20731.1 MAG: VapC toxin family PIN domain ribonuclease [Anaerolineae bacterium CG17_big_fil_post_rev_8_21_14_2_50_57_27]PIZ26192.1 MAG: VapC toxin family PIN domain ribonuclease [Chloroflexi bacterium CG_4_10_14_0_8_um_filter_57_5]PJH74966.1 MAG: VapC toxin family PIN domain ribonuclease [Anaerolineae bacterium CG_4_9_14_0_8_um_filter_58_9]